MAPAAITIPNDLMEVIHGIKEKSCDAFFEEMKVNLTEWHQNTSETSSKSQHLPNTNRHHSHQPLKFKISENISLS